MNSPIPVRFSDEMLAEIAAIQAGSMGALDRASVIRLLVAEALQARAKKGGQ